MEEVDEIDVGNAAPPVDIVDVDDDEVVVVGVSVLFSDESLAFACGLFT